jgi:hypothetical protein
MEKKVIRITFGKKNLGSTKLDKKKKDKQNHLNVM